MTDLAQPLDRPNRDRVSGAPGELVRVERKRHACVRGRARGGRRSRPRRAGSTEVRSPQRRRRRSPARARRGRPCRRSSVRRRGRRPGSRRAGRRGTPRRAVRRSSTESRMPSPVVPQTSTPSIPPSARKRTSGANPDSSRPAPPDVSGVTTAAIAPSSTLRWYRRGQGFLATRPGRVGSMEPASEPRGDDILMRSRRDLVIRNEQPDPAPDPAHPHRAQSRCRTPRTRIHFRVPSRGRSLPAPSRPARIRSPGRSLRARIRRLRRPRLRMRSRRSACRAFRYGTIFEMGISRMSVAPLAFSSGISRFTWRLLDDGLDRVAALLQRRHGRATSSRERPRAPLQVGLADVQLDQHPALRPQRRQAAAW